MSIEPSTFNPSDDVADDAPTLGPGPSVTSILDGINRPAARSPKDDRSRSLETGWETPDLEPREVVAEIKRVFSPLERELVGFGPLLTQAIFALLTRENLLVFSPAGTAKTLFASSLFGRISGARIFDTQMSKGTLAEELFGSVDIEQMKRGRVVHTTAGVSAVVVALLLDVRLGGDFRQAQ